VSDASDPSSPSRVLALLDDAAAGAALLELSSTLARMVQRELSVVYVESTPSLVAAALPFAQVLAPGGGAWQPLRPEDVERGFRAQAARLREMAARVALRDAVGWSMRVMRGNLAQAASDLREESDLLLLSAAIRWPTPDLSPRVSRRPVVHVLDDGSQAGQRAVQIARQLVLALGGVLELERGAATGVDSAPAHGAGVTPRCELLVLPYQRVDVAALVMRRSPLLLVA